MKAQTEDARRITADLAQNLQDLQFTYEEAYSAVMQALHPLLAQMTTTILPRLAHQSLVPRLTEMLHELARDQGRRSVEIAAAPDDMARLGHLLENEPDIEAALVEDDTLGSGQIYLRFGDAEREIDLSATLDGIDAAVAGFFDQHLQERATA
ncbi:MAG TPA: flagellar biosynthesis protein [Myxococcota bacterium]|nr:flagellar biosynthesis protein [Myxococcota bacterium]